MVSGGACACVQYRGEYTNLEPCSFEYCNWIGQRAGSIFRIELHIVCRHALATFDSASMFLVRALLLNALFIHHTRVKRVA